MFKRAMASSDICWFYVLFVFILTACASAPEREAPITQEWADQATVLDQANLRFWADVPPPDEELRLNRPKEERRKLQGGIMDREHHYLALSGGGENGAFTAGLLAGWSASGNRPEFTVVTGISTGALIAPFAFLGPEYDDEVREVYTNYAATDLGKRRHVRNIIFNDAVADSAPMKAIIDRYMTASVMGKIAYESSKGRILLLGTTNIDAARPVSWDITKIAASGHPGALDLIRDVMLASASIPVGFPPVIIEVQADGQTYQEMHVDGGVTNQVFAYPPGLDLSQVTTIFNLPKQPEIYVIRNAYLEPRWESVERKLFPLAARSISSLIRTQGIGDLDRMYFSAQRDGIDFHLAYIPETFDESQEEKSGIDYMRNLYQYAFEQAKAGYPWEDAPPGVLPVDYEN